MNKIRFWQAPGIHAIAYPSRGIWKGCLNVAEVVGHLTGNTSLIVPFPVTSPAIAKFRSRKRVHVGVHSLFTPTNEFRIHLSTKEIPDLDMTHTNITWNYALYSIMNALHK